MRAGGAEVEDITIGYKIKFILRGTTLGGLLFHWRASLTA